MLKWFKKKDQDPVKETLTELIEEESEEKIPRHERMLLTNILNMRELRASDVMIPRTDIAAVEASSDLKDVIKVLTKCRHTRLPVYKETLDDIVGVVYAKDILDVFAAPDAMHKSETLLAKDLMKDTLVFISPSMRTFDVLQQMQKSRIHMALVVDEFGGIDGLVTVEDLVEEIVGEIEDEDTIEDKPPMMWKENGILEADARVYLEDIEEEIDLQIFDDDEKETTDTVGGLVFMLAGRIPSRGELVHHSKGFFFKVLEADLRRVKKVAIYNLPRPKTKESGVEKNTAA